MYKEETARCSNENCAGGVTTWGKGDSAVPYVYVDGDRVSYDEDTTCVRMAGLGRFPDRKCNVELQYLCEKPC